MSRDFRNERTREIAPYVPGEQPQEGDWVKLNTNENASPPSKKVLDALASLAGRPDTLRKYPHPYGEPLRSALAKYHGVEPEQVFVANGSDEVLALVCHGFLEKGDTAAISSVTYSLYSTLIELAGGRCQSIEVKEDKQNPFSVDLSALAAARARAVFLPNPNAQTGERISRSGLEEAIGRSESLWVIDEAYHDFGEDDEPSFINELGKYDNAIVARTFSKSHSLAGARIGYAIASNPLIMQGLYAIKDSYNQDAVAIELGQAALKDGAWHKKAMAHVVSERARLSTELKKAGFFVIPSQANFILAKPMGKLSATEIYEKLKARKILVRHFPESPIADYLRITIGTTDQNDALIKTLQ